MSEASTKRRRARTVLRCFQSYRRRGRPFVWLQSGIEFFTNTAEPTAEAAATNTAGSTETARLIQNNISLSEVAMAVDSPGQGATPWVAELTTSQRIFSQRKSRMTSPGRAARSCRLVAASSRSSRFSGRITMKTLIIAPGTHINSCFVTPKLTPALETELWREFDSARPRILGAPGAWLAGIARCSSPRACRGWQTSPCGPRLAEQRCGPPAVLRTPMMRNAKPPHRDEPSSSLHSKTFA